MAFSRNHDVPQGRPVRDALSGQVPDRDFIAAAGVEELDYFLTENVWLKRPRSEAHQKTGAPPITAKWVDVNKGDGLNPNYRGLFVAREIRLPVGEAVFAPTLPLEALRTVLGAAATDWKGSRAHVRDPTSEWRTQICFIDVSKAHFNAKKGS